MRWWIPILLLVLAGLQYRFWYGEGGWYEAKNVQKQIEEQRDINLRLKNRNDVIAAEVHDLKAGTSAVEAKARADHGMARPGETYYLVVDPQSSKNTKP